MSVVYLEREGETKEILNCLYKFTNTPKQSGSWYLLQGISGSGKTSFLQYIERSFKRTPQDSVCCVLIPWAMSSPIRPLFQSLKKELLRKAFSQLTLGDIPKSLEGTDLNRFLHSCLEKPSEVNQHVSVFVRWLVGERLDSEELEEYNILNPDKLHPVTSVPYLKAFLDILRRKGLVTKYVFLVEDFAGFVNQELFLKMLCAFFPQEYAFVITASTTGLSLKDFQVVQVPFIRDNKEACLLVRTQRGGYHLSEEEILKVYVPLKEKSDVTVQQFLRAIQKTLSF